MNNRTARRQAARRAPVTREAQVIPTATNNDPEALVVTHFFDAADIPDPRVPATIRLTGRRVGTHANRDREDIFSQEDRVQGLLPDSGPASVTTCIYGVAPGD